MAHQLFETICFIPAKDSRFLMMIGDLTPHFGGNKIYLCIAPMVYHSISLALVFLLLTKKNHIETWFSLMKFIRGMLSSQEVGLGQVRTDSVHVYLFHAHQLLFISFLVCFLLPISVYVSFFLTIFLFYSLTDCHLFGLPNNLIHLICAFLVTVINETFISYYHLICGYFKLRVNAFNYKLKHFKKSKMRMKVFAASVIGEHNLICHLMRDNDLLWGKVYFITIAFLLPCALLVTQQSLFGGLKLFPRIAYSSGVVVITTAICIIT